jgi:hypothetical protein
MRGSFFSSGGEPSQSLVPVKRWKVFCLAVNYEARIVSETSVVLTFSACEAVEGVVFFGCEL